jgi:hypothetical protein
MDEETLELTFQKYDTVGLTGMLFLLSNAATHLWMLPV